MRTRGFTVVELLVVIVVIGILIAIVVVSYTGINDNARATSVKDGLKKATDQVELYAVQQRQLPTSFDQVKVAVPDGEGSFLYRTFDADKEYCLSYTRSDISYFVTSIDLDTQAVGSCADAISVPGVGVPLGVNTEPGTTVSFPTVSGTPALTIYAVVDIIDTSGSYEPIAELTPASASQRIRLDTGGAGSANLRYRIDTSASSNVSGNQATRTEGRHTGWLLVRSNMTVREFAYDKPTLQDSSSLLPGSGWSFTGLQLWPESGSGSTSPVAAVVYNASHDQAARTRVLDWLAKTYNAPISW